MALSEGVGVGVGVEDAFGPSSGSLVSDGEEDDEKREDPSFNDPSDEAAYYKDLYHSLLTKSEETEGEFLELQIKQEEYQLEAEADAHRREDEMLALLEKNDRLEEEVDAQKALTRSAREEIDELKRKNLDLIKTNNETINNMQLTVENLTRENTSAKRAVILLEQGNDDLEKETRNAHSSFLDMESRHNRLLEEKIMLEEDLEAKKEMEVMVQRFKDEIRDQAMEITFLKTQLQAVEEKLKQRPSPIHHPDTNAGTDRMGVAIPSPNLTPIPLPLTMPRSESSPSSLTSQSNSGGNSRHDLSRSRMSTLVEDCSTPDETTPTGKVMNQNLRDLGRSTNASGLPRTPGTPTGIPVARFRRVDVLIPSTVASGTGTSPSPSLKRSSTIQSLIPSPHALSPRGYNHPIGSSSNLSTAKPLSSSTSSSSSNALNRSTNSRSLASLAKDSPVPLLPPSTTSRRSLAPPYSHNSRLALTKEELNKKSEAFKSRLSNPHLTRTRPVARKPSGVVQRIASGVSSKLGLPNPSRMNHIAVTTQQEATPDIEGAGTQDLTMRSMMRDSPGGDTSWVHVERRETDRQEKGNANVLGQSHNATIARNREREKATADRSTSMSLNKSTTSSNKSEKDLPPRPPIPSPMKRNNTQQPRSSDTETDTDVDAHKHVNRNGNGNGSAYANGNASANALARPPSRQSTIGSPPPTSFHLARPNTPSRESRVPISIRPSSRMSSRKVDENIGGDRTFLTSPVRGIVRPHSSMDHYSNGSSYAANTNTRQRYPLAAGPSSAYSSTASSRASSRAGHRETDEVLRHSTTSTRTVRRIENNAHAVYLTSNSTTTTTPQRTSEEAMDSSLSMSLSRSMRRTSMHEPSSREAQMMAMNTKLKSLPPLSASTQTPSPSNKSIQVHGNRDTPRRSRIPRHSGGRSQSVIEIPTEPVPPLPFIPGSNVRNPADSSANLETRRRAAIGAGQIGMGLPSTSRRLG